MPEISIIIPAYNQAKYIDKTIESVIRQTFGDWECIIVNDGSTDDTEHVVQAYLSCDHRIKCVRQENQGPSGSRNTGLRIAQGKYIAFLDADDMWEPHMLEIMHQLLEKNSDIDIAFGAWDFIDETGKASSRKICPITCNVYEECLIFRNIFPIHTLLLRKTVFSSCGFFDTQLISMEDWDMWLRAARHGFKFRPINKLLAHYRRHSKSASVNVQRMSDFTFTVVDKFFNDASNRELAWKKPYVQIFQYLLIAKENRRYLSNDEISVLVTKAYKLSRNVVYNSNYWVQFYKLAIILPGSEDFLKDMLMRSPQLARFKLISNGQMKKSIYNFISRNYLLSVFEIITSCILWPPIIIAYARFIKRSIICL